MATAGQIYEYFERMIPRSLSCEWDNDGAMCIPEYCGEVKRVLLTLDVTEAAVERAEECGADMIISHHPLIFKPLKNAGGFDITSRKLIRLIKDGIAVLSYHTRLDAADGGVNDRLAAVVGIRTEGKFGEAPEDIALGRYGILSEPIELERFAAEVAARLGGSVNYVGGAKKAYRIALVGGDGKDFVKAAAALGADTYLTGSMSYNAMCDAADAGMNVLEAGHFFTENPVLDFFADKLGEAFPEIEVERFRSNPVRTAVL